MRVGTRRAESPALLPSKAKRAIIFLLDDGPFRNSIFGYIIRRVLGAQAPGQ
jgi:hypothetical protein